MQPTPHLKDAPRHVFFHLRVIDLNDYKHHFLNDYKHSLTINSEAVKGSKAAEESTAPRGWRSWMSENDQVLFSWRSRPAGRNHLFNCSYSGELKFRFATAAAVPELWPLRKTSRDQNPKLVWFSYLPFGKLDHWEPRQSDGPLKLKNNSLLLRST